MSTNRCQWWRHI